MRPTSCLQETRGLEEETELSTRTRVPLRDVPVLSTCEGVRVASKLCCWRQKQSSEFSKGQTRTSE